MPLQGILTSRGVVQHMMSHENTRRVLKCSVFLVFGQIDKIVEWPSQTTRLFNGQTIQRTELLSSNGAVGEAHVFQQLRIVDVAPIVDNG